MKSRKLHIYVVALLMLGCAGNDNDGKPDGVLQSDGLTCPEARNCRGRVCVADPVCGVSCGVCPSGTCNALGTCRADATCNSPCAAGESCKNGFCVAPEACSPGSVECAPDGFGFRGCGTNPNTGELELGPRAPCAPNDPCAAGLCAHTAPCVPGKVVFVVDRSSSMAGVHFAWAREAIVRFHAAYGTHNYTGFRFMPGGQTCNSDPIDVQLALDYPRRGYGSVDSFFDASAPWQPLRSAPSFRAKAPQSSVTTNTTTYAR